MFVAYVLCIEQRPEKPYNLTVKQTRQGLIISWIGPKDDHSSPHPLSYIIQYRTVGQWVPLVSRVTGTTSFNWTTASRGATYHFRVICYRGQSDGLDLDYSEDELLKSLPSDIITVHTGGFNQLSPTFYYRVIYYGGCSVI